MGKRNGTARTHNSFPTHTQARTHAHTHSSCATYESTFRVYASYVYASLRAAQVVQAHNGGSTLSVAYFKVSIYYASAR